MEHVIYDGPSDDAGVVLAAVAAAMARHHVAADDRAPCLAAVARALRDRRPGGTVRLTLGQRRLEIAVDTGAAVERTVVTTAQGPAEGPDGQVPADPWAELLAHIAGQHDLLDGYRRELEQTNKGVLALHAELADNAERLERAGRLQRRSLRAERRARAAAEAARARLAFLAHAGETLSESLAHERVLARLRELVIPRYARSMTVWLARGSALEPFPPSDAPAAPSEYVEKAYVSGRIQHAAPYAVAGGIVDVDVTPSDASVLAVPLVSNGVTRGVLAAEPVALSFAEEDVVLFGELGRITAGAIDNALRYEYERDVAERLQRAMLTDLPGTGRLAFTARYLPAEAGLNVGGDWYDAFERPDGDVIAAVGDVTGHGLQAAALMGQLRTALRAYALEADGPGHVLTCMHRMLSHLQPEDLATAVLAQWSPDGRLRWANAGHPPPLLRAPDGAVTTLDDHGFLLGMPFEGAELVEHSTVLRPGSTVLFYTDGLIERRNVPLDTSIARLAAAFGAATGELDDVADGVLHAMLGDSTREDDTCLLIFRSE